MPQLRKLSNCKCGGFANKCYFTQWTTDTVVIEKNKEDDKEDVFVKITLKKRTENLLSNSSAKLQTSKDTSLTADGNSPTIEN